jgi:hypothetical protein
MSEKCRPGCIRNRRKKYERRMKGHEVSHDKEMKDKVYLSKQKGWSERTHNTWGVKASPKSNQGKH